MATEETSASEQSRIVRILNRVADIGNKLPDPVTLFALIALAVVVASALLAGAEAQMMVEVEEGVFEMSTITVTSLLTADGIEWMYLNSVQNFVNFAPLGPVLMVMIGIGIAERTGLIAVGLRMMVMSVPKNWITATLIFACVMSSMAADAGYVVMVPLGAMLFAGLGRHPMAGLAAAFAGVSAGFSANLLITGLDPMLAEITNEAAKAVDPNYTVLVTANFYFLVVSVFLVTIVGTIVTTKVVEPMLGEWDPSEASHPIEEPELPSAQERRNFFIAMGVALVVTAGIGLLGFWAGSPLRDMSNESASMLETMEPFFTRLDVLIMFLFLLPGIVYGALNGMIKNDKDVAEMASDTMSTMGAYVLLAFPAGQFIAYFSQTNLHIYIADLGVSVLNAIGAQGIPLLIAFIIVSAIINLFIGSASAKWAVMGPVFVPMLMLAGLSPEVVQASYRVGDSVTNIITPLMPYLPIIIVFAKRYVKDVEIGTILTVMLPYSVALGIAWTIMLIVWVFAGIPIGPGAEAFIDIPVME